MSQVQEINKEQFGIYLINIAQRLSILPSLVQIATDEYYAHIKEQQDICPMKVTKILSILQGIQHSLGFPCVI